MKTSIIFIIYFLGDTLNAASAEQHSEDPLYPVHRLASEPSKTMFKRSYGWGLPLMFHNIAPGKISSTKREANVASEKANVNDQGPPKAITSNRNNGKDKVETGKVAPKNDPKVDTSVGTGAGTYSRSTDSSASSASQSSSKKKGKKEKGHSTSSSPTP
ncbi:uncharacterized protein FA14DRAFT_177767 [Meira miltonrushii]|uniref:Uncharacterized protein n=1 Tax=Meira miltonrushii TaxID=1280837 RepID=A0A316VLU8_9BASI|nr:uncharacterized protein FA14DRAFT_177767 [Meira miltonrushii]PWN38497.1 hypothetical protein FA14DRAFT_177767 [Meira miltonrushii]